MKGNKDCCIVHCDITLEKKKTNEKNIHVSINIDKFPNAYISQHSTNGSPNRFQMLPDIYQIATGDGKREMAQTKLLRLLEAWLLFLSSLLLFNVILLRDVRKGVHTPWPSTQRALDPLSLPGVEDWKCFFLAVLLIRRKKFGYNWKRY